MTGRTYADYIQDMVDALKDIRQFTLGQSYEAFIQDRKTVNAVVRSLEIIGEAAKQIPESMRKASPSIPFKRMSGMRDKLIHTYFGVDLGMVWAVIQEELPPLKHPLESLLFDLERNDRTGYRHNL